MALSQAELAALYEQDEPKKALSQDELASLFNTAELQGKVNTQVNPSQEDGFGIDDVVNFYKGAYESAIKQGKDVYGLGKRGTRAIAEKISDLTGLDLPEPSKTDKELMEGSKGSYAESIAKGIEDIALSVPQFASYLTGPNVGNDLFGWTGMTTPKRELNPTEQGYLAQEIGRRKDRLAPIEERERIAYGRGEGIDWVRMTPGIAMPAIGAGKVAEIPKAASATERIIRNIINNRAGRVGSIGAMLQTTGEDVGEEKLRQGALGYAGGRTLEGLGNLGGWAVNKVDDITRPLGFRNRTDELSTTLEGLYGKGITKDVREIIKTLSKDDKDNLIKAIDSYQAPSGESFNISNAIAQYVRKAKDAGEPVSFGYPLLKLSKELETAAATKDYMNVVKMRNEAGRENILNELAAKVSGKGASIQDKINYLSELRRTSSNVDYETALNKIVSTDSEANIIRKIVESGNADVRNRMIAALVNRDEALRASKEAEALIGSGIKTGEFPEIDSTGLPKIIDTLSAREFPNIESPTTFPPIGAYDRNNQIEGMIPYMNRVTDQTNEGTYSIFGRDLPDIQRSKEVLRPEDAITYFKTQDVMDMNELERAIANTDRTFKTDLINPQEGAPSSYYDDLLSPEEKVARYYSELANKESANISGIEKEVKDLEGMQRLISDTKNIDSKKFSEFMKYPAFRKAYSEAQETLANSGVKLSDDPREISIDSLQLIKEYLRKNIKAQKGSPGGIVSKEENKIVGIINELDDWTSRRSVDWKLATQKYANLSNKIDQLEFLNAAKSSLKNVKDQETLDAFIKAISNEGKMMQTATGYGRYGDVEGLFGGKTRIARDVRKGLGNLKESALDEEMARKLSTGEGVMPSLTGEIESTLPSLVDYRISFANKQIRNLINSKKPEYQNVAARILNDKNELLSILKSGDSKTKEMAIDFMNQVIKLTGQQIGRTTGE